MSKKENKRDIISRDGTASTTKKPKHQKTLNGAAILCECKCADARLGKCITKRKIRICETIGTYKENRGPRRTERDIAC